MHMIKRPFILILNFVSKMIMIILNIQCVFLTPYLASEKNAQMVWGGGREFSSQIQAK